MRAGRARKLARRTMDFPRIKRLPPYVFNAIGELCLKARRDGEDIIDFGMGNPDARDAARISWPSWSRPRPSRRTIATRSRAACTSCAWRSATGTRRRYGVELDPDSEAIVTIGSKEGIAHLALAILDQGDVVLAPTPTYPIHQYGCIIAGAQVQGVPISRGEDFFDELMATVNRCWPRPKLLVMNFPHNPTTATVDLHFMKRVVEFARENEILVVARFRIRGPVLRRLQGALDDAGGGRARGRRRIFHALQELQHAGLARGLRGRQSRDDRGARHGSNRISTTGCSRPCRSRRSPRSTGRRSASREITRPTAPARRAGRRAQSRRMAGRASRKATMFVWAPIPEPFRAMGSLEFAKFLLAEAKVAVSPGVGFGADGDGFVRFALIENEHRTRQAIRGIRHALR